MKTDTQDTLIAAVMQLMPEGVPHFSGLQIVAELSDEDVVFIKSYDDIDVCIGNKIRTLSLMKHGISSKVLVKGRAEDTDIQALLELAERMHNYETELLDSKRKNNNARWTWLAERYELDIETNAYIIDDASGHNCVLLQGSKKEVMAEYEKNK